MTTAPSSIKKHLSPAQNLAVAKSISESMRQIDREGWDTAHASVRRNMQSLYVRAATAKAKGN
jgi:hypothetical protein